MWIPVAHVNATSFTAPLPGNSPASPSFSVPLRGSFGQPFGGISGPSAKTRPLAPPLRAFALKSQPRPSAHSSALRNHLQVSPLHESRLPSARLLRDDPRDGAVKSAKLSRPCP